MMYSINIFMHHLLEGIYEFKICCSHVETSRAYQRVNRIIMKDGLPIKNGIVIPSHELEITASRSGGPGGQHVNKTSSRITVRWNVQQTHALNDEQKLRVLEQLQSEITSEGDLLVSNSSSRSQAQNKQLALDVLAQKIRKALYIPKKRMKVKVPKSATEARLHEKKKRGSIKAMRNKRIDND